MQDVLEDAPPRQRKIYSCVRVCPSKGILLQVCPGDDMCARQHESKVAWGHCGYTTHGARGVPLPLFVHISLAELVPITQSLQDCASVRMSRTHKSRAILEGNRRHLGVFRREKLHPEGAQSPRVRLRRYLMKLPLHVCVATTRRWQKHCVMS